MTRSATESVLGTVESSPLEALAEHLRDHAEENHDPADLARRFRLDQEFVEDVMEMLSEQVPNDAPALQDYVYQVSQAVRSVSRRINATFRNWTADPIKFVLYTGGFCMITLWMGFILSGFLSRDVAVLTEAISPLLFLCTLPLHLMCFFRHGRLRFPLIAAGVLALALIPAMTTIYFRQTRGALESSYAALSLAVMFNLAVAGIYAFLGCIASVLGGYLQVQREERRDRRLGRQELLERLFRMQGRLAQVSSEPQGLVRRISFKQRLRRTPIVPLTSFLLGGVYAIVTSILVRTATEQLSERAALDVRDGLVGFANVIAVFILFFLGYLAGRPVKAIMTVFLAVGGCLLAGFLPAFEIGRPFGEITFGKIIFLSLIGFFSGAGGLIEDRTFSKRKLREDDPAYLLAEMVRMQRRLKRGRRAACVMMVDVARSTAMKADSDQFDVEYSFRRYHLLVESISGRHRGDVVSTAGDGAVVVFEQVKDALRAAQEIHSEISRFNADVNRLRLPFNLRIGIHFGQTDSELHQAPYNELIDVAAHVQAMSPVGGIAMTESAATHLEGERTAEMTEEVDGHKVHISLDPVRVG